MTDHKRQKLKGKREEKRKRIAAQQKRRRDDARKQAKMELAAARAIDETDLEHLGFWVDLAGKVLKHVMETQAAEHLRDAGEDRPVIESGSVS